jgi:hypothetical protein
MTYKENFKLSLSVFFRLCRLFKELVQAQGFLQIFVTSLFYTVRSC